MKKIDIENRKVNMPYKVPEDYFDQLESDIQMRIRGSEPKTSLIVSWKWALVPAFVLIILFAYSSYQNLTTEMAPPEKMIASLSNDEIMTYLEHMDLSEYEIASLSNRTDVLMNGEKMIDEFDLDGTDLNNLIDQYDLNDINI